MQGLLLDELRLSASIVLSREEVVPRFRVMSPEGDWTVFVPLPDDIGERQRRMQLIYGFMAWKSPTAFVMSTELVRLNCVLSAGIGHSDVLIAARPILRKPLTLGPIEWLDPSAVGEEIVALLPRGKVALNRETEAALMQTFGIGGEFEARRN